MFFSMMWMMAVNAFGIASGVSLCAITGGNPNLTVCNTGYPTALLFVLLQLQCVEVFYYCKGVTYFTLILRVIFKK
jgi:hypothetical protein